MSKNGFERAANLAHHAKALAKIISNALAQNWVGAAVEAVKHYWPYILGAAAALILIPFIILCSLPSILFGFGSDTPEAIKGAELEAYYRNYDDYRNEQLEEIKEEYEEEHDVTCEIEYVNESFDNDWFIAIHSVQYKNDQDAMDEDNIKEFIKETYTYEIVDADESEEDVTEESEPADEEPASSGPWGETENQTSESSESSTGDSSDSSSDSDSSKIIKVTTLSVPEVMNAFDFDDEKTTWSMLVYEIYSSSKGDLSPNATANEIFELVKEDGIQYVGGEYESPFPDDIWHDHVTSEYGTRNDPATGESQPSHTGIDISMPEGTKIHAMQSGTVLFVRDSEDEGYGLHVAVNHGGNNVTLYAQCSEILVEEGDTVKQGDVIAKVGSTGTDLEPHLHIEIHIDGVPKNPRLYLSKLPPVWYF